MSLNGPDDALNSRIEGLYHALEGEFEALISSYGVPPDVTFGELDQQRNAEQPTNTPLFEIELARAQVRAQATAATPKASNEPKAKDHNPIR